MRLPKPNSRPKPKPPKEPPDESNEGGDDGYESCEPASSSSLDSTLLVHAQEAAGRVQEDDQDMALLLLALCDRLSRKGSLCQRLRDKLRGVRQELDDAQIVNTKHKNLQGQAHRYWLQIRRLKTDLIHARYLRTPRRWFPP